MNEEITVKKAVLHILDNNINIPVLSNSELEIDGEVSEFLEKHITKVLNDNNLKNACFTENYNKIRNLCKLLGSNTAEFLQVSLDLAGTLFEIMTQNVDIAPADLICCLFDCDGQRHLGILKLNYKTGYMHYAQQGEEGNANTIIRHRTILPSEGQKIDECALINLEDLSIKIIEKEYEINGEKLCYLSKIYLQCSSGLSNNEKLKIINNVAKKLNKKYFDEDFDKMAKLKMAAIESLEETSAIQIDTLAEEVFESNLEVRNEYLSEIQSAGLIERTITIPETLAEKKFKTHKIKTDTGIEINFPLDYYNDREKIEFVNNPDGTISIILKNIGKIINR